MKQRQDILLDKDNDLFVEQGDFVIGHSDMQHIDHIISAQPGEYKNFPLLGFGVSKYLKTITTKTKFIRDLRVQLNYDDYSNPDIDLRNGFEKINIKV